MSVSVASFSRLLEIGLHSQTHMSIKVASFSRLVEIGLHSQTHVNKCSFFLQTSRDWNALPSSLIGSAEGAEDGVAKFTSLVS